VNCCRNGQILIFAGKNWFNINFQKHQLFFKPSLSFFLLSLSLFDGILPPGLRSQTMTLKKSSSMIHIGKMILQKVNESGISKSELARRVNLTPQNIYNLFKRKSIDAGLLKQISVALAFDFFSIYEEARRERVHRFWSEENSDRYLEYQELLREQNRLKNENRYLKSLIGMTKKKGTTTADSARTEIRRATVYRLRKNSIS
jgi:hypothetical protein